MNQLLSYGLVKGWRISIHEFNYEKFIDTQTFILPNASNRIYCDTSFDCVHLFITKELHQIFLHSAHDFLQPSTRATAKLMTERFVWQDTENESRNFTRNSLHCQRNKITRHTQTAFVRRCIPSQRFEHCRSFSSVGRQSILFNSCGSIYSMARSVPTFGYDWKNCSKNSYKSMGISFRYSNRHYNWLRSPVRKHSI